MHVSLLLYMCRMSVQVILLILITQTESFKLNNSWSSCPFVSSLKDPNIFLITLFSNTLNRRKVKGTVATLHTLKACRRNRCITALQSLVDQDLLITHSVGLLWTSDQPDAETSTSQHTTLTTDIHALGGIGTDNSRRAMPQIVQPLGSAAEEQLH